MTGKISKLIKWGTSALRVIKLRIVAGGRMNTTAGTPLYLGKGARVVLGEGATLVIGSGVYLSSGCVVQVGDGASLTLEDDVYMNEGCRVTVIDSVHIGSGTLFGPNVQVYDHDHRFDKDGVQPELRHSPVLVGEHCWLCANVVITCGCKVADCSLVSANSVVTHDLSEARALYAGAPARQIKRYDI